MGLEKGLGWDSWDSEMQKLCVGGVVKIDLINT